MKSQKIARMIGNGTTRATEATGTGVPDPALIGARAETAAESDHGAPGEVPGTAAIREIGQGRGTGGTRAIGIEIGGPTLLEATGERRREMIAETTGDGAAAQATTVDVEHMFQIGNEIVILGITEVSRVGARPLLVRRGRLDPELSRVRLQFIGPLLEGFH